jgi:acid phosphatase
MVQHVVTDAALTHYSLSRYLAELGGASPLEEAATAASLQAAFGLGPS